MMKDRLKQVISFYHKLYRDEAATVGNFPLRNAFPSIEFGMYEALARRVSVQEVYTALFDMGPLKALGVDGLH